MFCVFFPCLQITLRWCGFSVFGAIPEIPLKALKASTVDGVYYNE